MQSLLSRPTSPASVAMRIARLMDSKTRPTSSIPASHASIRYAFIIGAVAIGLVLLDHSHCSGDQDKLEDPHAGHNH